MPSLFTTPDSQAILDRLHRISPQAQRQWGKMSAAQMLKHAQQPLRVALGELHLKRGLMGVLFGKMAKKQLLDAKPWKQGMPTAPQFIVKDEPVFEAEKEKLTTLVKRFANGGPAGISNLLHPFFGPMTVEEWDQLQWRHLDHHLRQFGA
ncbi:MAG TPA: DUF1569 domain-containing protein [Flavobacteriales bacterium]|nr:DUF1569 domain-containing protein [Flavobacteriales bacterium]